MRNRTCRDLLAVALFATAASLAIYATGQATHDQLDAARITVIICTLLLAAITLWNTP